MMILKSLRNFLPPAAEFGGRKKNKQYKRGKPMDHFFEEEFKEKVLDSKIPVIMDFYADWCGPCRALSPTIEKVAKEYEGKLSLVKVDCDECEDLSRDMEIKSIPTIIIMKDGEQIGKNVGYMTETQLKKFIDKTIKPKVKS